MSTIDREKLLVARLLQISKIVDGLVGWRYVAQQIQRDTDELLKKLELIQTKD